MRLYPLASSLILALLLSLSACAEPEEVIEDVTWEPALEEGGSTILDLGTIELGGPMASSPTVVATNNSAEAITFELTCSFDGGHFAPMSCWSQPLPLDPGESTPPVSASMLTNQSGEFSGSFQFIYGTEIATFVIEGLVQ
jgi:hypothetical protein